MKKQRPILQRSMINRKYHDFTQKIRAKRPQQISSNTSIFKTPISQKIHRPNPYYQLPRLQQQKSLHKNKEIKTNSKQIPLNQQHIYCSSAYRNLQQKIKQLMVQDEEQLLQLQKVKEEKKKELQNTKQSEYSIKLQIWQLRTEVINIKESIEQEKTETEKLLEELGITQEEYEERRRNSANQISEQSQIISHSPSLN